VHPDRPGASGDRRPVALFRSQPDGVDGCCKSIHRPAGRTRVRITTGRSARIQELETVPRPMRDVRSRATLCCTSASFVSKIAIQISGNSNGPNRLLVADVRFHGLNLVRLPSCRIVSDQAGFPDCRDYGWCCICGSRRFSAQSIRERSRCRLWQRSHPRSPDPCVPRSGRYQIASQGSVTTACRALPR